MSTVEEGKGGEIGQLTGEHERTCSSVRSAFHGRQSTGVDASTVPSVLARFESLDRLHFPPLQQASSLPRSRFPAPFADILVQQMGGRARPRRRPWLVRAVYSSAQPG